MVKINVDAAFNVRTNCVGFSVIIRDRHGRILKTTGKPKVTISSLAEEAEAMLMGVQLALDVGY